ncbi:MAG: hypothetical protein PHR21_09535 [Oscillospiraceae bacterium]|nr:hypothetical protein [Oscillospiraceae bacterium]MDD4368444.1 hypothetical protein [Oscillospiraceae bacterium]
MQSLWSDPGRRLTQAQTQAAALQKQLDQLSTARLITALPAFGFWLAAFWQGSWYWYLAAVGLSLLFILFLRRHSAKRQDLAQAQALAQVCRDRLDRRGSGWQNFSDSGLDLQLQLQEQLRRLASAGEAAPAADAEAGDRSAAEAAVFLCQDLDLLGPHSLFQRLNLAVTPDGRQVLAQRLTCAGTRAGTAAPAESLRLQEACRELGAKADFADQFMIQAQLYRHSDAELRRTGGLAFIKDCQGMLADSQNPGKRSAWQLQQLLRFLWPAVTWLCAVLAWLLAWPALQLATAGLLLLQMVLAMLRHGQVTAALSHLHDFIRYAQSYEGFFAALEQQTWDSQLMRELAAVVSASPAAVPTRRYSRQPSGSAAAALKQLRRLGQMEALRSNSIGWFLANTALLWDEHCLAQVRRWAAAFGSRLPDWLNSVAQTEALLSLASTADIYPQTAFPLLEASPGSQPRLQLQELHHPLLTGSQSVANPVFLNAGTYIITGSNMSGKTTYLRALGLAVVLARAGAALPCQGGTVGVFRVRTSIRVEDQVTDGISTFYAEIHRIQGMAADSTDKIPTLLLIDEIFKGTNSADRLIGARAAVRKLCQPWLLTVVTTHDFELCDLENDPALTVTNLHFAEYYDRQGIHFDYKLQAGRCQTTNARYLLRLAGILSDEEGLSGQAQASARAVKPPELPD